MNGGQYAIILVLPSYRSAIVQGSQALRAARTAEEERRVGVQRSLWLSAVAQSAILFSRIILEKSMLCIDISRKMPVGNVVTDRGDYGVVLLIGKAVSNVMLWQARKALITSTAPRKHGALAIPPKAMPLPIAPLSA